MAVVRSCARPSFSTLSLPFGLLIVGGTRNSCDDEDDVVPLGVSIHYVHVGRGKDKLERGHCNKIKLVVCINLPTTETNNVAGVLGERSAPSLGGWSVGEGHDFALWIKCHPFVPPSQELPNQ